MAVAPVAPTKTALQPINLKLRNFGEYRPIIAPELYDEVMDLAARLRGKRILQINSTATRGGVAEILNSTAPLLTDLGLVSEWRVIQARPGFFALTKTIHNGLQGDPANLTDEQWQLYETINRELAATINGDDWDYIMVHDPQPLAMRRFVANPGRAKWLWRYHGDSSDPNPNYLERLLGYLEPYDGAIFTLKDYLLKGFEPAHLALTPPAIDPLSLKNLPVGLVDATGIVSGFGINPAKPLITQVSRFDPWKDPLGVMAAWQLAKAQVPDLQLALVGNMAGDDPQAGAILAEVRQRAEGLRDLFILANEVGARASRAVLEVSRVVLQKSLREGFGLTVSEALWAGTPVVGGNVGGIRLQIEEGKSGYLTSSIEETAARIVELVTHPDAAKTMGEYGQGMVRRKFLLPRLIRDDLKFLLEVS